MASFGELLRSYRLRAGLGLRTFASLIEERASTVSAVESHRRAPWRQPKTLSQIAEVLGLVESSNLWQKILKLSKTDPTRDGSSYATAESGSLAWWWQTEDTPLLQDDALADMASFVNATITNNEEPLTNSTDSHGSSEQLTELEIEWRVRQVLGQRETKHAAPIDVEAVLENEPELRIEIIPGLIPRFSVQSCIVRRSTGITFYVDRIVADSRPIASYRYLLAQSFAPIALWNADHAQLAINFRSLQAEPTWPNQLRNCERFALALLLPANPMLAAAETVYSELVQQQGWLEVDDAARALRNRLAEQFAVPTMLVHRRLVGWPCHLYGRVAQALAAQEPTLPPLDWLIDSSTPQQLQLFS